MAQGRARGRDRRTRDPAHDCNVQGVQVGAPAEEGHHPSVRQTVAVAEGEGFERSGEGERGVGEGGELAEAQVAEAGGERVKGDREAVQGEGGEVGGGPEETGESGGGEAGAIAVRGTPKER
ncbi:hypothetical protein HDU96_004298 [Phlyctochytrium bullatum]|nr:hypothetical protein HDU96_004298 [Phlyctochytrium bullatum]